MRSRMRRQQTTSQVKQSGLSLRHIKH